MRNSRLWIAATLTSLMVGSMSLSAPFVFPYLNQDEVIEFIGAAAVKLSAGGLLFISTMGGRYENSQFKSRGEDEEITKLICGKHVFSVQR